MDYNEYEGEYKLYLQSWTKGVQTNNFSIWWFRQKKVVVFPTKQKTRYSPKGASAKELKVKRLQEIAYIKEIIFLYFHYLWRSKIAYNVHEACNIGPQLYPFYEKTPVI